MRTPLASIARNHLALECQYGHTSLIAVAELLPRHEALTAEDAIRRMRCTTCGARAVREWRIVYVGASAVAMEGARRD